MDDPRGESETLDSLKISLSTAPGLPIVPLPF